MSSISFYAKIEHLRRVQNLVKCFDGRFIKNPLCSKYRAYVSVSFAQSENMRKFHVMLNIMEQPFF